MKANTGAFLGVSSAKVQLPTAKSRLLRQSHRHLRSLVLNLLANLPLEAWRIAHPRGRLICGDFRIQNYEP